MPALPPLWERLTGPASPFGMVTAILLACPPNTPTKSSMGCVVSLRWVILSGKGFPIHALVAHVFVALDITKRFHRAAIVLTGCSSLVVERHA